MNPPLVIKYQPSALYGVLGVAMLVGVVLVVPLAGIFLFGGWIVERLRRKNRQND